jgi:hypothetical protein
MLCGCDRSKTLLCGIHSHLVSRLDARSSSGSPTVGKKASHSDLTAEVVDLGSSKAEDTSRKIEFL